MSPKHVCCPVLRALPLLLLSLLRNCFCCSCSWHSPPFVRTFSHTAKASSSPCLNTTAPHGEPLNPPPPLALVRDGVQFMCPPHPLFVLCRTSPLPRYPLVFFVCPDETVLLLRVFAVDRLCSEPSARESFRPSSLKVSGERRATASAENKDLASSSAGGGEGLLGLAGSAVWESVIDVRGLTALPAGVRLSHFWALPADCLLVEMSNGGLYAPGTIRVRNVVCL